MAHSKMIIVVLVLFLSLSHLCAAQNVKGVYWLAGGGLAASDLNSTLFTHIFFAFADLDSTTNRVVVSAANTPAFTSFTATVQKKNPSVKTLISIGGGASKPEYFASMASQATTRKTFIDSSISLARSNGFHGLDLDWEYPDDATKMANYGLLLNEWRGAVASEATSSGKPPLLLSAAVFYSSSYYGLNYPVSTVAKSLDWINAMAYDFYGPGWSTVTGPPAALYDPANTISGSKGVTAWIQAGLPANKLVLGVPFYGRAWRLSNTNNHGFYAPTTGAAVSSDGSAGYGQIKALITQNQATVVYNATVVSNYCYYGTTWIGYDDTQSISAKVTYAKGKGLLGYYAWQAGADDNWILSKTASQAWGA